MFRATAIGLGLMAAVSSSNSYQLNSYGIGSGGTGSSSSSTYNLNAATGQPGGGAASGASRQVNSGSVEAQQANVPEAPTLSNSGGAYYNKLNCIINMAGDAADYTYAIAVSTNGFTTTNYVQAGGALGSSPVYQTYSAWGSAAGSLITGLSPTTTYQVKVAAMQGKFSNSAYGPAASQATANPSLSFGITPSSTAFSALASGTVTDASSAISNTLSTNAANGGAIYIRGNNAGLSSASNSYTIGAANGNLTALSQGFGVQAGSTSQTAGGPMAAVGAYNVSGSTVAAATSSFAPIFNAASAVTGGSGTVNLKAKAAATTPTGTDYQEVLTFIASANY